MATGENRAPIDDPLDRVVTVRDLLAVVDQVLSSCATPVLDEAGERERRAHTDVAVTGLQKRLTQSPNDSLEAPSNAGSR